MKLSDTTDMMLNTEYKERFKAEYYQLRIRFYALKAMLDSWDAGTLNFKPTCPRKMYNKQVDAMIAYIMVLEDRAKLEGIPLDPSTNNVK